MNAIERLTPQETDLTVGVKPTSTMDMVHAALMRNAPMDLIEKLLALHERWEAGQARKAFDAAIAAAKAEITTVKKTKAGHNGKYEDMGDIANEVAPKLAKQGLSYRYRTQQTDKITVTCVIAHAEGHYEETSLSAPADVTGSKNAIQAIGSTITYLQRYTLKAALGLAASKDDDGAAANDATKPITEAQVDDLIKLADQAGANKIAFCNFMKVESFAAIPASKFEQAKKELQNKLEANRKKAAAKAVEHA